MFQGLKLLQNAKKNSVKSLVPKRSVDVGPKISLRKDRRLVDMEMEEDDEERDDLAELQKKIK